MIAPDRLPVERLRELFLFVELEDDKLDWIATHATVQRFEVGTTVAVGGEPARCFYVLLSGAFALYRRVHGDDVEVARSGQPGAWGGAVWFYLPDQVSPTYPGSLRTLTECEFLVLPADQFAEVFRRWYPMPTHLLQGLYYGMQTGEALAGQRERLLALGKLSAGLTHELNNPAAAVGRAAAALGDSIGEVRHEFTQLARHGALERLVGIQERIVRRLDRRPISSVLEISEREDELADWMSAHGVEGAWELAPELVGAGIGTEELGLVASTVEASALSAALRWLASTVQTEALLHEITEATGRISALVDAAKQYSQMDRAAHQLIDVHEGLDSTLVMLSRKLGEGVRVITDYDPSLPKIPAYAAELNQVWTNLIDNAVDAMAGSGTLTLRSRRELDRLLVEVCDTGPGVPVEQQQQIFEPFFTTKPFGQGIGLGLDLSWRIVVNRHGGDLRVVSEGGDTRFQVRLPVGPAQPQS
ncbi:MAG: ATP-binding protein [Pseudonocardiaceae bacterium]